MYYLTLDDKYRAEKNLKEAFRKLSAKNSFFSTSKAILNYRGLNSVKTLLDSNRKQIDEVISKIQTEERFCDNYLRRHCPNFYMAHSNLCFDKSQVRKDPREWEDAYRRIKEATQNIDDYIYSKGRILAASLTDGLKRRVDDFKSHGIGHPWGTRYGKDLPRPSG